jgi:hypothetical protein
MTRDTSGTGPGPSGVRALLFRHRPSRLWAFSFLGFFLLTTAWSLAMPYDGPPDELQHTVRAYGVVTGQIVPDDIGTPTFRVPKSLVPKGSSISGSCFRWHTENSAACTNDPGAEPGSEHHFVMAASGSGTYDPVYYFLVGLPLRVWPNMGGVIAARLLTGAIMSAFFAGAVAVAGRLRRGRWLTAGIVVAITPVAINLGGGVNPAGPEIAAGVALWAALIAVVEAEEVTPAVVALGGLAASGLAVFRGFGLGLLAVIGVLAVLGLRRGRFKTLVRNRLVQVWAGVAGVFMAFGLVWQQSVNTILPPVPVHHDISTLHVITAELWDRLTYYSNGMVGLTSYGDVSLPGIAYVVWYAAAGVVIAGGLVFCGWRTRIQVGGIIAASYAILALPDIQAVRAGWWLSQGRYMLPLIAGAPMLAAYRLGSEGVFDEHRIGQLLRALAVVLLPMQVLALALTMIRFQMGNPGGTPIHLDPFQGKWLPAVGPVVPLLLCTAGVGVLGWICFRMAAVKTPRPGAVLPGPAAVRSAATDVVFAGTPANTVPSPSASTN